MNQRTVSPVSNNVANEPRRYGGDWPQNVGWLVGCLLMILLVGGVSGFSFACGAGWIQLNLGQFQICGTEDLPPPPPPCYAECVREVAKLVSVEAYMITDIEYVNHPNLPEPFIEISKFVGLEEKFVVLAYGTEG